MGTRGKKNQPGSTRVTVFNNEVQLSGFLDSPETLQAKKEAATGQVKTIGTLADFGDWVAELAEN